MNMRIEPAANQTNLASIMTRQNQAGERFKRMLAGQEGRMPDASQSEKQKLRRASEQLVSSALLKPLFKQMRNSPFKVERFHGGQGEKAFMQQLHTVFSDRISESARFGIADAVYDKMSKALPGAQTGSEVDTRG